MQTQREAILAAFRHEQPEILPIVNGNIAFLRCPTDRYIGEGARGKDMFGVEWIKPSLTNPLAGSTPAPGMHILDDITEWESVVRFPDLDSIDWESFAKKEEQGADRSKQVITGLIHSGMFERLNQLMGMENALCAYYEEPEAVKDFYEALSEWKLKCIDYVVRYFDPDVVQLHDDWGTEKNTFFPVELWREFIKPHEKKFVERVHEHGRFYEHHSCGYITTLIDDLVEIGVDAINPVMVCNDIAWIKKNYCNRITLLGGMDNQLVDSVGVTEERMRAEVHRTIDQCAPGGSYCFWYVAASPEKIPFITQEAYAYGNGFYKK